MLRLLCVLVGTCMLIAAPAHAQLSLEKMERVARIVCSEEKYISAPEEYLWEERCNYRFDHDGAKVWFFHQVVTDFTEERCMVPKPWCQAPYRVLMILVRWPEIDEPNLEEFIADDDVRGVPSFAVFQSNIRDELRFDLGALATGTDEGRRSQGLEHRSHWVGRFGQLIDLLLARDGDPPES